VERLVEGKAVEGWSSLPRAIERGDGTTERPLLPGNRVGNSTDVRPLAKVGNNYNPPNLRNPGSHFAHPGQRVDFLAGIAIAIGAEQNLGLDLAEAIEHPVGAKVRRAGRPDGADAGRGEH